MGVMNNLRDKYGKYVIFAIGFAILAFVMYDLFSSNSAIINGSDNAVGEIAGEEISAEEYQFAVNEMRTRYQIRSGRAPSESELTGIRQQAWDLLIARNAYQQEFDKLGIRVSSEELIDMTQGKNLHPSLEPLFKDPETGKIDRSKIAQEYARWNSLPEGPQKLSIRLFEQDLPKERVRLKYNNLLSKTDYTTQAEAIKEYSAQNDVAEVKYLYIPYYSINDSSVAVSDADLKNYLNEHKEEYKTERSRSMKYVEVPVVASAEDTTYWKEDLASLIEPFKNSKADSLYAKSNSDGFNAYTTYKLGKLPQPLKSKLAEINEGDVIGPMFSGTGFKLYKVSTIEEDTLSSAKARHILIKWEGGSDDEKAEAKSKAQEILKDVRGGADFEETARDKSEGPSNTSGGDLGWFTEKNAMVAEFDEAVFGTETIGVLNQVVETQFGYHIIKVEERSNKQYKIAEIERNVTAGEVTINEAYRIADYFAAESSDMDSFEKSAEEKSLEIVDVDNIDPNAGRVGNINEARPVVQWLFREAKKGSVSETFDLGDRYVVAIMTSEQDKGYSDLESVRETITQKVRNEKKAQQITAKLKSASGDLDQMSASYGADAKVYTSSDLKLSTASLPSVGRDDKVIGKAFGLKAGENTAPIAGENGVLVVKMNSITKAPEVADYNVYKDQLTQARGTAYKIDQAIKEFADIEDKRYKVH